MSDYPIQGKLRIRPANFEQDVQFIREHTAELTEPELKSVPGYDYLKFWYADFACTDQQWAVLAPELDKRNILATLFEAPLFAVAVAKDENQPRRKPSSPVPFLLNTASLVVLLMAAWLFLTSAIDGVACAASGVVTLLLIIAGRLFGWLRARRAAVVIEGAPPQVF